jgi:hypothetical protein
VAVVLGKASALAALVVMTGGRTPSLAVRILSELRDAKSCIIVIVAEDAHRLGCVLCALTRRVRCG